MLTSFASRILRSFAALLFALQTSVMAPMPAMASNALNAQGFVCVLPGADISPTMQAAAERLQALIDADAPDTPGPHPDCPFCMLVAAVILPTPGAVETVRPAAAEWAVLPLQDTRIHAPRGPPLGARAPPVHI